MLIITACNSYKDTFSYENLSGKVRVKGYVTKYVFNDGYCEENCQTYEYYMFKITDTKSDDFKKYLNDLDGNSFGGINEIGLGCVKNNIIYYNNYSDKKGSIAVELSKEDSEYILDSNEKNIITLELEKEALIDGRGAPDCYSHITNFKVIK